MAARFGNVFNSLQVRRLMLNMHIVPRLSASMRRRRTETSRHLRIRDSNTPSPPTRPGHSPALSRATSSSTFLCTDLDALNAQVASLGDPFDQGTGGPERDLAPTRSATRLGRTRT